jgi:hypothetical protein
MGTLIGDLWDHEGYATRRLPDGTLTGTWSLATADVTAYLPTCGCGWHADRAYPPTEDGEAAAIAQWRAEHAEPLLDRQAERYRAELAQALRALGGIADFVDNPANLSRIGRAIDRVRELVADLEHDQERRRLEREAGGER